MNSADLLASIRTIFKTLLNDVRLPQKATVTAYDPQRHYAKVSLKPQGLETGWLQVGTIGVGSGFGFTSGLRAGDEVLVHFENGDINSGVVTGVLYNGQDLPVLTNAGEHKIIHESGSYIKFFANGSIEIYSPTAVNVIAPNISEAGENIISSCSGVRTTNTLASVSYGPNTSTASPSFNPGVHTGAEIQQPDV